MPFGVKPFCSKCDSADSEIWHKDKGSESSSALCNECHIGRINASLPKKEIPVKQPEKATTSEEKCPTEEIPPETNEVDESVADEPDELKPRNDYGPGTRSGNTTVSFRGRGSKRLRGRTRKIGIIHKTTVSKGRGRRAMFKKQLPSKAPSVVATTITTKNLFYRDTYYQVGDIVSIMDEDTKIYYAQIRGLLQDQFCEKSAVLTWLIPTQSSPPPETGFDPLTYILGPEEELPRKLDYLEFVMHAPNEYYKLDDNIRISSEKDAGFIWTSMGAVKRTIHG